jgi:hypothetical protein
MYFFLCFIQFWLIDNLHDHHEVLKWLKKWRRVQRKVVYDEDVEMSRSQLEITDPSPGLAHYLKSAFCSEDEEDEEDF